MCDIYFWRQWFVLSAGLLFSTSIGNMLAFPAVLHSAIISNNSTGIQTTRDQASWITASSGIAGILGAFILSPILSLCGRKAAHIAVNLSQLLGWVIFPFATNINTLYAARLIQGLSVGGVYINNFVIGEYVHPSRRGYFTTLKKVATAIGSLCCHAMGTFWTWRQISMFAIAPPFLAIVLTLFWPESPSYLALNGRFKECEKSFKWLSGDGEESQKHLKSLIEAHEISGRRKKRASLLQMAKTVLTKDFQKPILIMIVLILTIDLCGRHYFFAYVTEIMMTLLGDKTSSIYFTLGADLLTIIALSSSTLVIRYFNRRTLLFTFGGFSVVLMLTVSLLVFLNTLFKFPTEILWLTGLIIVFLSFVVNVGVVPVAYTLVAEIIPLEHRGLGSLVTGLVFTLFFGVLLKLTPVLISNTGLYGTYSIYGVCMGLCLMFLYRILPETKDKTLQEIDDEIKGIKRTEMSCKDSIAERNTLI